MLKVVLDTNFLLVPGQLKIDVFAEISRILSVPFEFCIYEGTVTELEKIASTNNRDKPNANVALSLIKQKNLKRLKNSLGYVDKIILENADKNTIVCTQDKELRSLLKKQHIKTITLRNNKIIIE